MNEITTVFVSWVSLSFLAIVVLWLYKDYRTDAFRQKMFSLRDRMFDDAMAGKLSFDDDGYGMLRSSMNGFIRFGHRLNLLEIVTLGLSMSRALKKTPKFDARFERNISDLPNEKQKLLRHYYVQMNRLAVEQVIKSSLLLSLLLVLLGLLIVIPIAVKIGASAAIKKLRRKYRSALNKLDAAALDEGDCVSF